MQIGDRNDRVIERSMNVGDALGYVLFYLLANFRSCLGNDQVLLFLASDGFARTLACPGIGTSTLATARQTLAMS